MTVGEVHIYEPAGRRGPRWAGMFRELWSARELTWRLCLRDLSARYRQSVLGYVWAVLPAIGTAALFTYLRQERVLSLRDTAIPFPAYVLLGMVSWQLFQGGLQAASGSLVQAGNLVAKVRFPRESLVLAAVGGTLFDALLRLLLVAIVFAWLGVAPAWTCIFFPLVLLPLLLLTTGLGFLFSIFNAVVRDVGSALPVALGLFFFLVPVVYPPPVRWPHVLLNDWNPVAAFVIAAHDVAVLGYLTRPASFAAHCAVAALIFLFGWRVFRVAQPLIAERI